ncbi:MAG: YqjF family protein [Acidimicrobiales bacterium]
MMSTHIEPVTADPVRRVTRPIMIQGWRNLASLHWRYRAEEVQKILPQGYRVDTFEGDAWVGLIPFHMRRIRLPKLPPLGPLSTFPETNIRTYIVDPEGRRGVWFASLDVTRLIPALVARATYRLPYCWSRMSIEETGDVITYSSERRWPRSTKGARSTMSIRRGDRISPEDITELEHFLTARWALGTTLGSRLMWAEVDHPAWPLHRAEVLSWDETLLRAAGLPEPRGQPVALYSPGVEVRIGLPERIWSS